MELLQIHKRVIPLQGHHMNLKILSRTNCLPKKKRELISKTFSYQVLRNKNSLKKAEILNYQENRQFRPQITENK